jgi:hypothetical protein
MTQLLLRAVLLIGGTTLAFALVASIHHRRMRRRGRGNWWIEAHSRFRRRGDIAGRLGSSYITASQAFGILPDWTSLQSNNGRPANGTPTEWWSEDGLTGYIGHWRDGVVVEDRQMTALEAGGGGSSLLALLGFGLAIGVAALVVAAAGFLGIFGIAARIGLVNWLLFATAVLLYGILRLARAQSRSHRTNAHG